MSFRGTKIVRRSFRDRELAALFEWAADNLVIATPTAICDALEELHQHGLDVLPAKLHAAFWRYHEDGHAKLGRVLAWHDSLEPGEMVFLPPEPWQVR